MKGLKLAIAVGPVAGVAASNFSAAGGGMNGLKAASGTITSAYTGWDVSTNSFKAGNLALGYVPLIGAWAFGKVASRVLRV